MNTHTLVENTIYNLCTLSHIFNSASVDGTLQSKAPCTRPRRTAHTSTGFRAAFLIALYSCKHGTDDMGLPSFLWVVHTKGNVGLSILQVFVKEMVVHLSFGGGVQSFPVTVGAQSPSGTVVR